jgi:hypothetical protein
MLYTVSDVLPTGIYTNVLLLCLCVQNGFCSKHFPKDFCDATVDNEDGYPEYKRPDDGRTVLKRVGDAFVELDNRYVVPYNASLLLKYQCHINVEYCASIKAIKYLYTYVYKGHDRAQVRPSCRQAVGCCFPVIAAAVLSCSLLSLGGIPLQVEVHPEGGDAIVDEIQEYLDGRYYSSTEACWRLYAFDMHGRSHSVTRLAVHMPLEQRVVFQGGTQLRHVRDDGPPVTTLTAYFDMNRLTEEYRDIKYPDMVEHFTWKNKQWRPRTNGEVLRLFVHHCCTAVLS